jgi:hypothetical protein
VVIRLRVRTGHRACGLLPPALASTPRGTGSFSDCSHEHHSYRGASLRLCRQG